MAGKEYIIMYRAMDQLYIQICGRFDEWYSQLDQWSGKYQKLVSMDSFQGKSAESVKAYLKEVHGLLEFMIRQTLQTYQTRYLLYKNGYYQIDEDIYSEIPQEAVTDVRKKLKEESRKLEEISDDIERSLRCVSDILPLRNPSIYYLKDSMDGLEEELQRYDNRIEDYEANHLQSVRGDMQVFLDSLEAAVQNYRINGAKIASYQPGDITGNVDMLNLYQQAMANIQYIEEHQEDIQIAVNKQQKAYEQMQIDYEEACQERELAGKVKVIQGGFAMLIGAVAIVGTAGMATPAVITAGVTGTCSFMYGVSTGVEGAQDWYLGSIGDLDTAAVNPIRDTIFFGNQELYDLWGQLNMSVAGMCIPVGQSINSAAGMGNAAMVKAAAKTIVNESTADLCAEWGSSTIAKYTQETLNLSASETALLKTGLEIGISKGLEGITARGGSSGFVEAPEKTLDISQTEEYAFRAIKGNDDADAVVLGKYENGTDASYDIVAEGMDAQYFNLDNWDALAAQYTSDEIWKVNEKFLEVEISSGRQIYLTHDPAKYIGDGSFFSNEIKYLQENGYRFVKEGDLWRAVR